MYQFTLALRQSTYIIILVSCSDSLSMLSVFGDFPVSIHVSQRIFPPKTHGLPSHVKSPKGMDTPEMMVH